MKTDVLDQVFPMQFRIDSKLDLTHLSPRLRRHLPGVDRGTPLLDVFTIHRPQGIRTNADLCRQIDAIFLLVARDHEIALRGQVLEVGDSFRFIGMPWLAWMSRHDRDSSLELTDFPKFDSQMDQQFYLATQQSMVRDLEALNAELHVLREAEQDASRMRSDFFAVMSHEMRTPLNGVMSALSLLRDPRRIADRDRLIEIADVSANQLMAVINHALDYSKIDAGAMEPEIDTFRLEDLIHGVIDVAMPRAQEKELDLQSRIDPNVPSHFEGDFDKLRQILMNLVGNAIKYTDAGSVTVTADLEPGTGRLHLEVSDTGCGIAENQRSEIFRPYWTRVRGDHREAGTGLGLHICQRLVQLMEGEIDVYSRPDAGSRFVVMLPLAVAVPPPGITTPAETALPAAAFSGCVLIVDDNETNLLLGEMILEGLGLTVSRATSGREAIGLAENQYLDLVLMDIAMPDMDGIETTQKLLRHRRDLPVVALTAHVGTDLAGFYASRGFSGYLRKPLEHEALVGELERWLPRHHLHTEYSDPPEPDKELLETSTLALLKRRVGQGNFERIRGLFLSETERRIALMLAAWVRRDLDAVRNHAHSLAGSAGTFGCERLVDELRAIEHACSTHECERVIPLITGIEATASATLDRVRNPAQGGSNP